MFSFLSVLSTVYHKHVCFRICLATGINPVGFSPSQNIFVQILLRLTATFEDVLVAFLLLFLCSLVVVAFNCSKSLGGDYFCQNEELSSISIAKRIEMTTSEL